MGPFVFKNVINEIQIRQGKYISSLEQISENEPSKDTAISQTSDSEPPKEETETTDTIVEKDYESEKPKISATSQITLVFIAVLGVLLFMIFVLYLRSRVS